LYDGNGSKKQEARSKKQEARSLTKRLGAFPWSFALEAVLGTVEESGLEVLKFLQ
jgi:hypothetical protein